MGEGNRLDLRCRVRCYDKKNWKVVVDDGLRRLAREESCAVNEFPLDAIGTLLQLPVQIKLRGTSINFHLRKIPTLVDMSYRRLQRKHNLKKRIECRIAADV